MVVIHVAMLVQGLDTLSTLLNENVDDLGQKWLYTSAIFLYYCVEKVYKIRRLKGSIQQRDELRDQILHQRIDPRQHALIEHQILDNL